MIRPVVVYIAARVVPAVMSVLFMVVCAQMLSAPEYGAFTLTLLPSLIVSGFAGGLAGQAMLRFATELSPHGITTGLFRVPLLAALALAFPLACYLVYVGRPAGPVTIAIALVPATALLDTRRNLLVSLSRVKAVFLLDAVRSIVSLLVLALLVLFGVRSSLAPLSAMLAAAVIPVAIFSRERQSSPTHSGMAVDRRYLLYGFWVALWLAANSTFPLMERTILERHFGLGIAGTYSILADPLAAVSSASVAVMVSAFMPMYVSAWADERSQDIRRLTRIAMLSIVLVGLGILIAGTVIRTSGIGKYAHILRERPGLGVWLLGASTVWQLSIFLHKPLELRSRTREMFFCLVAAAVVFAISVNRLLDVLGVSGVAAAKTISGLVYAGLVLWASRDRSTAG